MRTGMGEIMWTAVHIYWPLLTKGWFLTSKSPLRPEASTEHKIELGEA